MQHHFAHAADSDCATGLETALHLAAKSILETKRAIVLPSVEAKFTGTKGTILLASEKAYEIEKVELERRVHTVVPDVLAYIRGRAVAIEIRVTHAVDDEKESKVRALGLSTVEVDLSRAPRTFSLEELEPLVVGGGKHKTWIFNAAASRKRDEVLSKGVLRRSVNRRLALHVDGCPIRARVWNGQPYANLVDDCIGCEHALEIGPNMNSVICSGVEQQTQTGLFLSDG